MHKIGLNINPDTKQVYPVKVPASDRLRRSLDRVLLHCLSVLGLTIEILKSRVGLNQNRVKRC